jgi:hypothetical protein
LRIDFDSFEQLFRPVRKAKRLCQPNLQPSRRILDPGRIIIEVGLERQKGISHKHALGRYFCTIGGNPGVKPRVQYRNLKGLDELAVEIHMVKENEILTKSSRSAQKFMHGIRVLMAKNYIDNLSEEVK